MSDKVLLEVCVESTASAMAAERGGAHRIELCSSLAEGGTTPSAGLIEIVRRKVRIPVHIIIRPRGGDFCYSSDEFESMKRDILTAKELKADGVVFGLLTEDGHVDVKRTQCLVEIADPMKTTFHRAFDMSVDLNQALEDVADAGVDRVLTSGGRQNAQDAIPAISRLIADANGKVAVMIGGGIRESNVRRILTQTGAREIHANLGETVPSSMRYRNEKISLGEIKGREYQLSIVSETRVRRLLEAASGVPSIVS